MIGLKKVPGKTSLPRQGPFLVSRQEKKIIVEQKKTPILGIDHSFPTENTQGAYAIRPYSLPAGGFRIRFAKDLGKTRRVSLRLVAKSKTRRVLRYVVWQSPKPAEFRAMSCGKFQNPPGFAPCRMAKSKTRRVLRYIVWQSPKPAGFRAMSFGRVQNPPGFALCRVAKSKTRRVLRYVVWRNPKPAGFHAMSCGGMRNLSGIRW